MNSTISTVQRYPLYRMLSTLHADPSTTSTAMKSVRFSPMWMRMLPEEAQGLSTLGLISQADYTETVNRFIPPIVVEAYGGLGNRLKVLVSAMCAGKDLGKDARVIWLVKSDCGAKFTELFDLSGGPLPPRVFVHNELSVGYVQHDCDTQTQWDAVKGTKTVTYLKAGARFHTTADADFVSFLKGFKAQKVVLDAVAALGDLSGVVGVHIRSKENTVSVTGSPQSAFVAAMNARPTAKFFVASDSDTVRAELEAQFPGRILTVAKDLSRGSKQGLQDALKDFVALSKCSEILGSKGSSFSEMAGLYGGVNVTVVTASA